jgi:hypothetical protein
VRHLGSQTTHQEFKKTVDRRALKEKANACFVLKNVQNKTWLLNFMLWTVLKSLKMLVTLDRQRAWATWQVMLQFPALMKKRREQNRLDDLSLLARVESCRVESSRVSSSYTSPHQV